MHFHQPERVSALRAIFQFATLYLVQAACVLYASPQISDNSTLVVVGRVSQIFQSMTSNRDFLIQILVQKSEATRFEDVQLATRYPAPGEFVYAHVAVSASDTNRRSQETSVLPKAGTTIRAVLRSDDDGNWTANSVDWYQEIQNDTATTSSNSSGDFAGIATETVVLSTGPALKVTAIESNSPAAKAGLEVGDILVSANDVQLTRPDQLSGQARKGNGKLQLVVRDVRTGRDVSVDIIPDTTMRENASQRSLGITTEIAFFAGKAVLKVVNVAEGSPAQRVGIKSGLLILFADDRPLTDPEILATAERESDGILVLRVVDPQTRVERTIRADLR